MGNRDYDWRILASLTIAFGLVVTFLGGLIGLGIAVELLGIVAFVYGTLYAIAEVVARRWRHS
jgi:4-hydroxybenzoate polyprenyltransferase